MWSDAELERRKNKHPQQQSLRKGRLHIAKAEADKHELRQKVIYYQNALRCENEHGLILFVCLDR
jgi:hypothetical protein